MDALLNYLIKQVEKYPALAIPFTGIALLYALGQVGKRTNIEPTTTPPEIVTAISEDQEGDFKLVMSAHLADLRDIVKDNQQITLQLIEIIGEKSDE